MQEIAYIQYINNQIKYHQEEIKNIYNVLDSKTHINNMADLTEMINQYIDDLENIDIFSTYTYYLSRLCYHHNAILMNKKKLTHR